MDDEALTFHAHFDHRESDEILLDSGMVLQYSMMREAIEIVVAEKLGLNEESISKLKFRISASVQMEEEE